MGSTTVPSFSRVPPVDCSSDEERDRSTGVFREKCWSPPTSVINKTLVPHFESLLRLTIGTRTRNIKSCLLRAAHLAVLAYGITEAGIRDRFSSFRADPNAVAKTFGANKLRSAMTASDPGRALLEFIVGTYDTTEPARVQVKAGGLMCYRAAGKSTIAAHSFKYSTCHRGLFIVGGGGRWRLDTIRSTDTCLVWKNLIHNIEGEGDDSVSSMKEIVYTRML